jgi:hypothetical protein
MKQDLPADHRRPGLEVQPVAQLGEPAALVGIEDVSPDQINSADNHRRIGGRGIRGTLSCKGDRAEEQSDRQEVPKMQPNSR